MQGRKSGGFCFKLEKIVIMIVKSLPVLKAPSLGKFTGAIQNLALKCPDVRVLTVSDNTEIQMKVSVTTDKELWQKMKVRLEHLNGVEVKFDYVLPTVGKDPDHNMLHYVALGVDVAHLLAAVREIDKLKDAGVEIDQIYDFCEVSLPFHLLLEIKIILQNNMKCKAKDGTSDTTTTTKNDEEEDSNMK